MAVLAAFLTTSCKKAYECTCSETESTTYAAVMSQYSAIVDNANTAEQEDIKPTNNWVTTFEKTTKANANESCASSESTVVNTTQDTGDADTDGNDLEAAYTQTIVTKTDCSVEKK